MPFSRRPLLLSLSAALLLVVTAGGVWAAPPVVRGAERPETPETPPRQDANDALSDSVRRIERTTHGLVLSAERVPFDGRSVNRIKVVDDRGRVRVYMDDPQSRPTPTRDDDD